ncbi:MAG: aldo/keto reductase [Rhodospirillaceae bacterium]|jgi:aryl-alcohol dehydrogenase-like predicted oxidoreductase|nr:aldo/keto reductase [Rhodospirillaceae bacterium]MBT5941554.1 aldo/keto reductase [Rhodospirillaceae bacterium]MBT7268130.1 aldo/keto reductase [Rhodospirillaceae bacterium]
MRTRKLGSQGLEVPAIGLGCMGMTIQYGELDDVESAATINHALDIGLSLLNTSDAYGKGKNETLIGEAIKGRRDDVIINTKFGNVSDGTNGRPEYVKEACEASLQRLGIDHIEIYSQHRVDTEVPIEETVGAMKRLIDEGKVSYLGLSEAAPETIRRAHAEAPITCVETEYSLWSRDVEAEILPTCQELGISLMPYAPLGRGFLTGTIKSADDLIEGDRRSAHPRFAQENIEENNRKVAVIEKIAESRGFKPAQVAIAWVLAQDELIVPIPGTKHRKYLDENVRATDIALLDDQIQQLNDAFPSGETAGDRYPAGQMKRLGL